MANVLLTGIDWGSQLGSLEVTYFFQTAGTHDSPIGTVQTDVWTDYEAQQVRKALAVYESITNLHFTEVSDEGSADIVLANTSNSYMSGYLGVGVPPGEDGAGQVLFNYQGTGWDWFAPGTGALEQGGYGFITIIHELGHAMGLAHPHDKGGTSTIYPDVTSAFNDYGDFAVNQGIYTTMSYNDGWHTSPNGTPPVGAAYGYQGTMMAFDIAVLQEKYGANMSYHTGGNSYVLRGANQVGTYYSCIWDAGGQDQIAYNGSGNAVLDLRAATLELGPGAGGWVSYVKGVFGGFTIAHGVVIEMARGGYGNDRIIGNNADNKLFGRAGNDAIHGYLGDDVIFGGRGRDYMHGGGGADTFDFNSVLDSRPGSKRDIIYGFQHGQQDQIDLSTIDPVPGGADDAFRFIGGQSFNHYDATHGGRFGMVRVTAANLVQIDVNGDGRADMEIRVNGSHLTASDFVL